MFDYHMHSTVSFDGHDTAERMIRAAADAGLKEICFTDHIDHEIGKKEEMVFDFENYRRVYSELAVPEGLKVRFGVEYGLKPYIQKEMKQDLAKFPFDFVIGSVHLVDEVDVYLEPYWKGKSQFEAEHLYFDAMLECVRANDDFDVLGHLTYISKTRANPTHRLITLEEHGAVIEEIMKVLVSKGKGMEINTSGVDRCGDYLPSVQILRRFKELGGQIVTVGSDAHTFDRVGQYTREACAMAKEIFGYVCTFEGRKPIFHKL